MKIFFAHSVYDYGTEQEKIWLDNIREYYPGGEIISSSTINDKIDNNDRYKGMRHVEEKYFFPLIDNSDVVIIVPSQNVKRFTIGAVIEMKYAFSKDKKIQIIENGKIRDIDESDKRKCEDTVAFHIPGEDPVRMIDLIKDKGFNF